MMWSVDPVKLTCHHCNKEGVTEVNRSLTDVGVIACCCLVMALLCCIPCCIDGFNKYTHSCSSCKKPLGARMGGETIYY